MKVLENVLIAELTTMRLGGTAKYVVEIEKVEDVAEAYRFAKEKNLRTFILGSGANTIGRDEGFDGVILLNKIKGIETISENEIEAVIRGMGGEIWDDFVKYTVEKDLSGIEALAKIPGTVGAAPVQNIGAYGQEIAQVLENVEAYDSLAEKFLKLNKDELKFSYRKSILNNGENVGRYFVIAVTVKLKKNTQLQPPFYTSLQKYVDENHETDFSPKNIYRMVSEIRAEKLPDPKEIASAGSFFKNVYLSDEEADEAEKKGIKVWRKNGENKINSGWLIENAGIKGRDFHGMHISEKAALILINDSAKSYADLTAARAEIRKIVKEKFGFELEQEPVEIF